MCYIAPNSFTAFYAQNPDWVRWIAMQFLGKSHVDDPDVDDLAQEFCLFLMTIPEGSVFEARGCTDRIQTFNPLTYESWAHPGLCFGFTGGHVEGLFFDFGGKSHVTAGIFFNYIKMLLRNYFTTRFHKHSRDAMSASVQVVKTLSEDSSGGEITEDSLVGPDPSADRNLVLRQFRNRLSGKILAVYDSIASGETQEAGAARLGIALTTYQNYIKRMRRLAQGDRKAVLMRKA